MSFEGRQAAMRWLDANARRPIRLGCEGSTLRLVGTIEGVQNLDACSTEIPYTDLRTGVPGVQIGLSLHEQALALHVLAGADGARAPVALPLSIPYERLLLAPADAPEPEAAQKEPAFSPYELLHRPRPD